MNISAKFQLHLPLPPFTASVEMIFEYFFANLGLDKIICLVEDYSRNISVKHLSKYLQ